MLLHMLFGRCRISHVHVALRNGAGNDMSATAAVAWRAACTIELLWCNLLLMTLKWVLADQG
jgi:hypothetical protein